MLSLFEFFSSLLEFLVNYLNSTVSWLSPFRIRIQSRSEQELSAAIPTVEDLNAESIAPVDSATNETQQFTLFAIDLPLREIEENGGEFQDFKFTLAAGEWLSFADAPSDTPFDAEPDDSTEQSPSWYELIADAESNTLAMLNPVPLLLDEIEQWRDRISDQQSQSLLFDRRSPEPSTRTGDTQTTRLADWVDEIAVIDSPLLSWTQEVTVQGVSTIDGTVSQNFPEITAPDDRSWTLNRVTENRMAESEEMSTLPIVSPVDSATDLSATYGVSLGAADEDLVTRNFSPAPISRPNVDSSLANFSTDAVITSEIITSEIMLDADVRSSSLRPVNLSAMDTSIAFVDESEKGILNPTANPDTISDGISDAATSDLAISNSNLITHRGHPWGKNG